MLEVKKWVAEVAQLTTPDYIHWCDGSEEEYDRLVNSMVASKSLHPLNPKTYPGCYLYHSDPNDVARTEHLTFVCTKDEQTAGSNNNWMPPKDAHEKMDALFNQCMKGRTMYVIPYCMGPIDSTHSRVGIEITDSPYVVINMKLMTRMGTPALQKIEREKKWVKGIHSTGDLNPDRRFVMHFPEESTIKSFGSGYGGNALLGKKCHSLRLGSFEAQKQGWLAEHMLILGVETPEKEIFYMAAAFPSACGKTNLAMMIPCEEYAKKGWKIFTVGDDIAWMHLGVDGKLYAINPEAGYFGVVPGTSLKTNPNAFEMIKRNTIFTNVALTDQNEPWWEGKDSSIPAYDWKGNKYIPGEGPAAHPNSRFTVSAHQCAAYTSEAENPEGVPISAIIFGGRRPSLIPLVTESKDWGHGVLMGAALASETTAAATGKVGVLRRDSMAMRPFCGYDFGSYFSHWLSFKEKSKNLPKIYTVNWFRQDSQGKFIWPGFGENIRVLEWMVERIKGTAEARKTPVGHVPTGALKEYCDIEAQGWLDEMKLIGEYLKDCSAPKELVQIKEQIELELRS